MAGWHEESRTMPISINPKNPFLNKYRETMRSCSGWRIRAAGFLVLLCMLHATPRAVAQVSCTVTYNCHGSAQCASLVGGPQTLEYPDQSACDAAAKTVGDGTIASCSCGAGTTPSAAPAVTTGSLAGDVLNLGANLWIIQNVKNPYTAVFAQNFSQGFFAALFSNSNSDTEVQRQQQLAYEEVQRQQQEAAERARIREQQRIDAMFARLNSQLKLSGSTIQLALKTGGPLGDLSMKLSSSDRNSGLKLKLGDASTTGYGIQGLPGIYVGGPDAAENSGGLKLKLGDASAPAPAVTQTAPPMGIAGLPGLSLNNVEPSQAAQLADMASILTGTERPAAEDAALRAARGDAALNAPSDDPFVKDYQEQAQIYDGAMQRQQEALQKASEAEGHVQADKAALNYANTVVQSADATEAQKQALQQMQYAAKSDEEAAVAARAAFEQTDVHLSIARERVSNALASLAPPPSGASTSSTARTNTPVASGQVQSTSSVATSAPVPMVSMSSKPQILALPATGGQPHVMSVNECLASFSPTGAVPSSEELQKKLESTMTAMERIAKSQETANDLQEEWGKELSNAHQDIFNNVTDAALDGLLDLSVKSLEKDKELYHQGLEASKKESQQLRAEYLAIKDNPGEKSLWDAKKADYLARAQYQLGQRQVIEDQMASVKKTQSVLEKLQTGRDFKLWLTDNELSPCKFNNDGKVNCDEFKKNNGIAAFARGDLNTQLDLLKQVVKFGMQYSPAFKTLSYGSMIGETWSATSFAIDTAYDGLAIVYSKRRLDQVKQSEAQFASAREVLGDRIDRLNAEIGCYPKQAQGNTAAEK